MSRPIGEGDKVTVYFCNQDQLSDVVVLHVPSDTGDMWYFETANGNIHAINPQASNLESIVKEKKRKKSDVP